MPLSVDDQLEIMQLLSKYYLANDNFDAETMAQLYTDDGALIVDGVERLRGRENVVPYILKRAEGTSRLRHWSSNVSIEGEGGRARMRSYMMAYRTDEWQGVPVIMGEYDDELVKVDGAWRFSVRRLTVVSSGAK